MSNNSDAVTAQLAEEDDVVLSDDEDLAAYATNKELEDDE